MGVSGGEVRDQSKVGVSEYFGKSVRSGKLDFASRTKWVRRFEIQNITLKIPLAETIVSHCTIVLLLFNIKN